MQPYREDWRDKCRHLETTSEVLKGGEGPDEAAELIRCKLCAMYRWKYCDGDLGSWQKG